jgi:hypothetical protein
VEDSLLTEGRSSFVSSFNGRHGMGSTSGFLGQQAGHGCVCVRMLDC